MHTLKILKARQTLEGALTGAVNFKRPMVRNDRRLFSEFAEAANRFAEIGGGLKELSRKHLDIDLTIPVVEGFGARAASMPYHATLEGMEARLHEAVKVLAAALEVPQLGRIDWADDESCRFTFFEVERDYGLLRNTVRRVAHTHDLVKARLHRLPADEIARPKRAHEIVRAIPDPLRSYVRIVTGLEVLKDAREDSRRDELTWLGQALQDGKDGLNDVGRSAAAATLATANKFQQAVTSQGFRRTAPKVAAGVGIATVGGALLAGLYGAISAAASAAVVAVPLAVADPAIVIGDLCLFGWEN